MTAKNQGNSVHGHLKDPIGFLPSILLFTQQMGRLRPEFRPIAFHVQGGHTPFSIALDMQARQIRLAPGMAQDDRQTQRHELLHKPGVLQFGIELAQLATVAKHQLAQAV